MFILKRQDVEISSVQHPKQDQQIPILNYQGQTFRLLSVFNASQAEEAKAFWRDLTDNRGKACVLLEEPDRHSVWGKIRLEQLAMEVEEAKIPLAFTQACLLLLQAVYLDAEDFLGNRQAEKLKQDLIKVFTQYNFPNAASADAVGYLLTVDPLDANAKVPSWDEHHLIKLLQELYRLGKDYFGNANFAQGVAELLQDIPKMERQQFLDWLKQSPLGKLWS